MKKKLADSPLLESPKSSPKIPRRRRSRILETLKEYEEEAEKASPEMPGSPCSSEELNTPLLKRIAKKLFKAQQASPSTESPITKAIEFEISNDGFSQGSDMAMTCQNQRPKETSKNGRAPQKKPIEFEISNDGFSDMDMTCENRRPKETPKNGAVPKNTKNKTTQPKKRTLVDTTKKANEVNLATKKPDSTPKINFLHRQQKKTGDIASLPVNKRPEPDTSKKAKEVNSATKRPDSVIKRPVFRPPTKKTDDIASLPVSKKPESVQNSLDLNSVTKQTNPTPKRPNIIEEQINKTMELQQPSPKPRPTKSKAKSTMKKKLYTQTSILSETPVGTPENVQPIIRQHLVPPMKKAKTRTKIIKKGSLLIAKQPSPAQASKENVYPGAATQSKALTHTQETKKAIRFGEPLTVVQNKKRVVRSLRYSTTSRRSSMDFIVPESIKAIRKETTMALSQKELVLTACPAEDQHMANEIVKVLPGNAKVALQVRSSTTHVISGDERRTLNMLKAIIRGCWVVSKSWLLASMEAGGWVDEEPYELVTFSAAIKARRLEREADFLPPKCDLLTEVGPIYIGRNCKVPRKDLADLIPLAGGQTVNQLRMANVILGHDYIEEFLENDKVVQISEKWLLDSLQQHCPLPFVDYLIQK